MAEMSEYEFIRDLSLGASTRITAMRRRADGTAVVVKRGLDVARQRGELAHEVELGRRCQGPGVIEYLALADDGPGVAIVMADGGRPLKALLSSEPLDVERLLDLFEGIAEGLATVHQARVVHADVSLNNLLVGDDGGVRLIDFGASRLRSARAQGAVAEAAGVGTLEYVSPELTGRMSRAADERADLYSMGAVWFHLAAGRPPFECETPLDFVHAHMAVAPPPLEALRPDLPAWLCRVVARLLEKSPEQRYQSAHGVLHDLRAFRSGALQPDAALGQDDTSDQLRISGTLLERGEELRALGEAARSVASGGSAAVLVHGAAGSGKTTLLHRFLESLTGSGGLVASGRFDPHRAHHPYSAIGVAIDSLAVALAALPGGEGARRQEAIRDALGDNAGVLTGLSRALGALLGPVPAVAELGPSETLNRLHSTFRALCSACAQPGQPFVLFLDDLQWIDPSSAELLRVTIAVAQPARFLLVGAYRSMDAGSDHPLSPVLGALEQAPSAATLEAHSLSPRAVRALVAESLGAPDADDLADEVHRMTRGNAHFVRSVLVALSERDAIRFDRQDRRWTWDLDDVRAQGLAENVVDLIKASLLELPGDTTRLVCVAAAVGAAVSAERLAALTEQDPAVVPDTLAPALECGLLVTTPEGYVFVDDRIGEAARQLIPDEERPELHRTIATELVRSLDEAQLEARILEVVGHLVCASEPEGADARALDAGLFRQAARHTARAMAHADTARYLGRAIALLGEAHAQAHPDDWFDLKLECATSTVWSGDPATSGALLDECVALAGTPVQRARVDLVRIAQTAQISNDYAGAVVLAIEALRGLGLEMPDVADPEAIQQVMGSLQAEHVRLMQPHTVEALAGLPDNDEPLARLTMALLAAGLDCAFIGIPQVLPIFVVSMVNYSIAHGNTDSSALGYMWFGVVQAIGRSFELASAYADAAMRLHERRPNPRHTPALLNMLGGFIQHVEVPFTTSTETCRRTYLEGERSGEHVYGGYGLVNACRHLLWSGAPLSAVRADAARAVDKLLEYQNVAMADLVHVFDGFTRAMSLDQLDPIEVLDHYGFSEQAYRETYHPVPVMEPLLDFYRILLLVYQGRLAQAHDVAEQLATVPIAGQVELSLLSFYAAFTKLATCSGAEAAQADASLAEHVAQLDDLAARSPYNYGPCAALVRAEQARVHGDLSAAEAAYEEAIALAERSGLHHLRGLACERASLFFEGRGLLTAARGYHSEAIRAHVRWGATLRVRQLMAARPQWQIQRGSISTRSLDAAQLDTAAITEATRLISSEVELDSFLSRTMGIVLKSAGAQSAILFTHRDGAWWRQAQATDGAIEVEHERPMVADGTYAHTVIDFVIQTRQAVTLPDPEDEARFSDDPYLAAHRPGSVLCVPLLRRGELAGVVYLEHQAARGAFTSQRAELLETLLAQAAISLEHAYLHQHLDRLVQQRTQQLEVAYEEAAEAHRHARMVLDSVEQGLVLARPDGTMLEEHSATLELWLGQPAPGAAVWSLFEPHDATFALSLEVGFEMIEEGFMPLDVSLASLPRRTRVGERQLAVDYDPVMDGEALKHVLVIISDVTAEVLAEAATQAQRDLLAFFNVLTRDPRSVYGFLSDGRAQVAAIEAGRGSDVEVRRQIHTLKGNSGLFGLTGFARRLHAIEDQITERHGQCTGADRAALAERWAELEAQLAPVLSSDPDRLVTIERDRFEAVIQRAEAGVPGAELAQELREWDWDEVRTHLDRLAEQAEALAQRLDKSHVDVTVGSDPLRLPPDETWSAFWGSLVHVVRNAIDHGIEDAEERLEQGKPKAAHVALTAREDGASLIVEIADDGRGIDWEKLGEKARATGLPYQTPEDRIRALFADGVSTRDAVTTVSGRGVGAAAVHAACLRLGGHISVTSRRGQGTRFCFTLPLPTAAPPEELVLA